MIITEESSLEPVAASATAAGVSERQRLEQRFRTIISEDFTLGRKVSYSGNRRTPFLRLYRYKEAFSLSLVDHLLDQLGAKPGDVVFDPFAGMGTTLFASMLRGLPSFGIDRLPIAVFVAKTLPNFFEIDKGQLLATYEQLLPKIETYPTAHIADDVQLVRLAFDEPVLTRLRRWKSAILDLPSPLSDVFLLLFFGILESVGYASNDGQFPRIKRHKKLLQVDEALRRKLIEAEEDLNSWPLLLPQARELGPPPLIVLGDAREAISLPAPVKPTILITSPPYANRYDYTRSYCLELCFHFVRDFADLRSLRLAILRSHIESRSRPTDTPAHPAIHEVSLLLKDRKLNNPRILPMLLAYFVDMSCVIAQWAAILPSGAKVAMVVDNVRFDGEVIPVDLILSEIAEHQGFQIDEVRVARYKGNSSQQMGRFGREFVRESILFWRKR